jgi:hypothetical protein
MKKLKTEVMRDSSGMHKDNNDITNEEYADEIANGKDNDNTTSKSTAILLVKTSMTATMKVKIIIINQSINQ